MRRTILVSMVLGSLALLICGRPAAASPKTYDITFGATDFVLQKGNGTPPIDFVLGRFRVTLDTDFSSAGAISLDFVQLPHDSTLTYQYTQAANEKLIVSGATDGDNRLLGNNLSVGVGNLGSSTRHFLFLFYSTLDPGGAQSLFLSTHGNVHVTAVPATTPIPAALPLFATALFGLGLLSRRRAGA